MMSECRFITCNKCTTVEGEVVSGGGSVSGVAGSISKSLYEDITFNSSATLVTRFILNSWVFAHSSLFTDYIPPDYPLANIIN